MWTDLLSPNCFPPLLWTNQLEEGLGYIYWSRITISRIKKKLTKTPVTCHCSLVPPCRLRSKGRSSLRKDTRRYLKIFHTYHCRAFFPRSFLRLVSLYALKRLFFSKHIFVSLLRIPQHHQPHFVISEGTDVLDDCRVQSTWPVQVIPQLSEGSKGGQGDRAQDGWLPFVQLASLDNDWAL